MKTNKTKAKAVLHGECLIFEAKIPQDAVKENTKNSGYEIIADSETTGNHHVIDLEPGIEFFKKGETRFVKNSKPMNVRCLHADRHDTIQLPAGEYQIGYQQEFDYFEMAKRNVRD